MTLETSEAFKMLSNLIINCFHHDLADLIEAVLSRLGPQLEELLNEDSFCVVGSVPRQLPGDRSGIIVRPRYDSCILHHAWMHVLFDDSAHPQQAYRFHDEIL